MKCICLGSTGYIGSHLVHFLKQNGDEVLIPQPKNGVRLDLTCPESLLNINWDVDVVYMFAGVTGTVSSFDQYNNFLLGNNLSLLNVLNAIRHSQSRPRVLYPSTRLVYRGLNQPLTENSEKETNTLYSANKLACEHYLHAFSNAFDIPYTILRICVPYDNLFSKNYSYGTVGNFISQAIKTKRILIYGDGSIRRTFTHIEDLCHIIRLISTQYESINNIYNTPGDNLSLYKAASLIAARFNATVECVDWPKLDSRLESNSTVFDSSKILKVLQFSAKTNFLKWSKHLN